MHLAMINLQDQMISWTGCQGKCSSAVECITYGAMCIVPMIHTVQPKKLIIFLDLVLNNWQKSKKIWRCETLFPWCNYEITKSWTLHNKAFNIFTNFVLLSRNCKWMGSFYKQNERYPLQQLSFSLLDLKHLCAKHVYEVFLENFQVILARDTRLRTSVDQSIWQSRHINNSSYTVDQYNRKLEQIVRYSITSFCFIITY